MMSLSFFVNPDFPEYKFQAGEFGIITVHLTQQA
jgi:hypothetical protein